MKKYVRGTLRRKTLLYMKFTSLILIVTCSTVMSVLASDVNAQNILDKRVSVSFNNVSLVTALKQISQQTGVGFTYSSSVVNSDLKFSASVKNVTLKRLLDQLFANKPFEFSAIDDEIAIKYQPKKPQKQLSGKKLGETLQPPQRDITGVVTDTTGTPLVGATVKVRNIAAGTTTDANGHFLLKNVPDNGLIEVSFIGYTTQLVILNANTPNPLNISLHLASSRLAQVAVVSTGYQSIPQERATGSFDHIDNALFNRSVGTNIIDRLDGVTSGLIFNKNYFTGDANSSPISIRGLSTIYANAQPLIVVDNFPIDGDLSNINPNDVQDITVLKDAAAASIWGARSGNGVIVITTKKGGFNKPLQVQFNANYTYTQRPNAYYSPNFLDAADFINAETFLFSKGFYDADLANTSNPPVISPVVEILNEQRNGTISAAQANAQINALKGLDIRNDISKYVYRGTGTQQYGLNINGGGPQSTYYFSAGYDNAPASLVGNDYNRLTVTSNATFIPVKNLTATAGLTYTITNSTNNDPGVFSPGSGKADYYPYAQLADANGNPLPLPKDYRYSYITTLNDPQLLDWTYEPLAEIGLADNTTQSHYTKFNTSLKYTFLKGVDAWVSYQLENQSTDNENLQSQQTYYTRNLINLYTQPDDSHAIPLGSILDQNRTDFTGNSVRAQLDINETFANDHQIVAIAGIEGKQLITNLVSNRQYGYSSDIGTTTPVDYVTTFNQYNNLSYPSTIPYENSIDKLTDELFSYFANASYTYKERYILSGSGRIDQSNLFGVNTNQKSVPLWSVGGAWEISREPFYNVNWLPYLKLRTTYGYNGNIDKALSAYTTALFAGPGFLTGAPEAIIQNPPDPELTWEKIGMLNVGADFATKDQWLKGSIEYFHKYGKDILGYAPVDLTTGVTSFQGNVASMEGQGFDIDLTFHTAGQVQWYGDLLVSKATDKVTKYNETTNLASYLQASDGSIGISAITPVVGRPVFALYSYKWAGLDPATGDPRGYLNGQVSEDYAAIESSKNINDAVYNGPARPTVFGSFRNTFIYKHFSLSWNIAYEFGFYFRRPSINYTNLATAWIGNSDYALRWQKPGDEAHTNVPSFTYPLNTARDNFYQYSSVLVDKGDNIRLKDISLNYDLSKAIRHLPFKSFQVYGYANNIGILWKATKSGLDPNYVLSPYPNPRTFSLGIKTTF